LLSFPMLTWTADHALVVAYAQSVFSCVVEKKEHAQECLDLLKVLHTLLHHLPADQLSVHLKGFVRVLVSSP
jgi:hypothetical protein